MTEPKISIDMKQTRIRIHKSTLHALGDPNYISLIINPEKQTIGIKPGTADDKTAHRIKPEVMKPGKDCELHSRSLIEGLTTLRPDWKDCKTRRIAGSLIPEENMCCFEMKNAEWEDGEKKS